MSKKYLPKTRECQECKYKFKIPPTTQVLERIYPNLKVYCPRCDSTNIAIIRKFNKHTGKCITNKNIATIR